MSDDSQRMEVITGAARRRRWSTEEKLRIVEETLRTGESISILARRHGVAPNLLYRWRRLMTEGGAVAVQADDAVTANANLTRTFEELRSDTLTEAARLIAEAPRVWCPGLGAEEALART